MAKTTRKQKIAALAEFASHKIETLNFQAGDKNSRYQYYGQTKAGRIGVSIWSDSDIKRFPPHIDIMMMFDDPSNAREHGFDCNPFSGKYNWHCIETTEQIDAIFATLR